MYIKIEDVRWYVVIETQQRYSCSCKCQAKRRHLSVMKQRVSLQKTNKCFYRLHCMYMIPYTMLLTYLLKIAYKMIYNVKNTYKFEKFMSCASVYCVSINVHVSFAVCCSVCRVVVFNVVFLGLILGNCACSTLLLNPIYLT